VCGGRGFTIPFIVKSLKWCGYPTVKKFDDMFSCFDRIPACDVQTDGRTDRRTPFDSIVRAVHSISRGKTPSDEIDVAGIPRHFNTKQTRIPTSFIFHHSSGLALISAVRS